MRKIKNGISFLCISIVLFSSCTKSTPPPHLKAVPADAVFVVALENKQLIKKGRLDKLKEYKFFQAIQTELDEQEPAVRDLMSKLIENPRSSGLDLDQTYIYGLKREDGFCCVASFKMDNLSDFEKNLSDLFKQKDNSRIEDKGAYKLAIHPDNQLGLAWNKEIFLIFGGDLSGINYEESLALPQEKSIVSMADFQDFLKQKYDIGFWAAYDGFIDIAKRNITGVFPDFVNKFSGLHFHVYAQFEAGEIKVTGSASPKSKLDEFYAQYPVIKKDFNTKLLEDFPETSFAMFKMAINVDEYLKLITEFSTPEMQDEFQSFLENESAKTIIAGLGGDLLVCLYGFAQGPIPVPLAGASFSVKNPEDFDKIRALFPEEMIQKTGDFYTFGTGGVSAYLAYKDKRVFLTDDADAITAFTGKGYSKNLNNSPLAENLKKDPALFYLNLDLKSYPGNIQTFLQGQMSEQANIYLAVLEPYKDFSYGATSTNDFYVSLKFKDTGRNALEVLLKSIDEINR